MYVQFLPKRTITLTDLAPDSQPAMVAPDATIDYLPSSVNRALASRRWQMLPLIQRIGAQHEESLFGANPELRAALTKASGDGPSLKLDSIIKGMTAHLWAPFVVSAGIVGWEGLGALFGNAPTSGTETVEMPILHDPGNEGPVTAVIKTVAWEFQDGDLVFNSKQAEQLMLACTDLALPLFNLVFDDQDEDIPPQEAVMGEESPVTSPGS